MIEKSGRDIRLEVDGGVECRRPRALCVDAGADVLVAGSATFQGGPDRICRQYRGAEGQAIDPGTVFNALRARRLRRRDRTAGASVPLVTSRRRLRLGRAESGAARHSAGAGRLTATPPARAGAGAGAGRFHRRRLGRGRRAIRLAYRWACPARDAGARRSASRADCACWRPCPNPLPGDRAAGTALRAGHFLIHGARGRSSRTWISASARADPAVRARASTVSPGCPTSKPARRASNARRWPSDILAPLAAWPTRSRCRQGPRLDVGMPGSACCNWLVHAPLILSGSDRACARALLRHDRGHRALARPAGAPRADDRLAASRRLGAITAAGLLLPDGKPRRLYGEAGLVAHAGRTGGRGWRHAVAQSRWRRWTRSRCWCGWRLLSRRRPRCPRADRDDAAAAGAAAAGADARRWRAGQLAGLRRRSARERSPRWSRRADVRTRPLREARHWGYQRLVASRTVLQFDAAPPPLRARGALRLRLDAGVRISPRGRSASIVNCGGAAMAGGAGAASGSSRACAPPPRIRTLTLDDANSTAV